MTLLENYLENLDTIYLLRKSILEFVDSFVKGKKEKKILTDIVNNLSDSDVASIFLYGKEMKHLDESQRNIIRNKIMLNEFLSPGAKKFLSYMGLYGIAGGLWLKFGLAGTLVGIAGWAAYRLGRALFDKCARSCGPLSINSITRQYCIAHCKYTAALKKKEVLENALSFCKDSKNPQACKEKINKQIEEVNIKIEKRYDKVIHLWNVMKEKGYDSSGEPSYALVGV